MKTISCRANFTDTNALGPLLASYDGGDTYHEFQHLDALHTDVRTQPELLMVHGYNTVAKNVCDAYRSNVEIAIEEGIHNILINGFLWPGKGGSLLAPLEFVDAEKLADQASARLAEYAKASIEQIPLSIMTHSLGARVALNAIQNYGLKLKVLALTGPAVDADALVKTYPRVCENVGKTMVFWSSRDRILRDDFPLSTSRSALGHTGCQSAGTVLSIDCSADVAEHGDYRFDRKIWIAVREALK